MSDAYTEFSPLGYDQQEIGQRGYGMAYQRGPRPLVAFIVEPKLNAHKSELVGRPVYEDKVMFTHRFPGETLQVTKHEATELEKRQWPAEWSAFIKKKDLREQQREGGIPMEFLFPSNPSICAMLEQHSIFTVEQLANLSAHAIQTVGMGCQEWVNKASRYVEQAEKGVNTHRYEKEMEIKDQRIATLERQIAEMSKQVNKVLNLQDATRPNFDAQSAQIAAMKAQEQFSQPPIEFSSDITTKRRGRPPGSRNKPKE